MQNFTQQNVTFIMNGSDLEVLVIEESEQSPKGTLYIGGLPFHTTTKRNMIHQIYLHFGFLDQHKIRSMVSTHIPNYLLFMGSIKPLYIPRYYHYLFLIEHTSLMILWLPYTTFLLASSWMYWLKLFLPRVLISAPTSNFILLLVAIGEIRKGSLLFFLLTMV